MRHWSGRESDVSSGCQTLCSNFFLLTSPKCYLGDVEKAMFQVFACHFEIIFGLLTIIKCDMGEVEKAIFQVLARHSELNFCLLTTTKCGLCEYKKAMFQVVEMRFG